MNHPDRKSRFEDLVLRNRGRLTGIASTYASSDGEDLLQEILLQIWRSLDKFENRACIDTWCYRVALNTAISWKRAHQRRKGHRASGEVPLDQLAGNVTQSASPELLQQFMQILSDIDRALLLMYLDDLSGSDMAETLGISVGAVRIRIHRIKQRLATWEGE